MVRIFEREFVDMAMTGTCTESDALKRFARKHVSGKTVSDPFRVLVHHFLDSAQQDVLRPMSNVRNTYYYFGYHSDFQRFSKAKLLSVVFKPYEHLVPGIMGRIDKQTKKQLLESARVFFTGLKRTMVQLALGRYMMAMRAYHSPETPGSFKLVLA